MVYSGYSPGDMYLEWIEMIYISVFDDFNYHAIRMKKCSVVKKKKKSARYVPDMKKVGSSIWDSIYKQNPECSIIMRDA